MSRLDATNWFYQSALLTLGAIFGGVAWAVAGWLVGLFAATLPLPPGARLAATVAIFSALLYYVAIEPGDDETLLNDVIGRWA